MDYTRRFFHPPAVGSFPRTDKRRAHVDLRDGSVYVYDEQTVLAVNVAMATGRPLLVRGPSGCGKSTLAQNVAKVLGWRYYEAVVSSRTQARDLLWEVDLVRRLQDAQAKAEELDLALQNYVVPGVLWKAFDPGSAKEPQPRAGEPGFDKPAVVLLDEIDKADPDVPNNLLVPLGSLQFRVEATGQDVVAKHAPLIFLTTNNERELPAAFLRRCVELKIDPPQTAAEFTRIGEAHFSELAKDDLMKIARLLGAPEAGISDGDGGLPPDAEPLSAAEYLDTVLAYHELQLDKAENFDAVWAALSGMTAWKHGRTAVGGR